MTDLRGFDESVSYLQQKTIRLPQIGGSTKILKNSGVRSWIWRWTLGFRVILVLISFFSNSNTSWFHPSLSFSLWSGFIIVDLILSLMRPTRPDPSPKSASNGPPVFDPAETGPDSGLVRRRLSVVWPRSIKFEQFEVASAPPETSRRKRLKVLLTNVSGPTRLQNSRTKTYLTASLGK